jgi:hypothetical protein
MRGGVPGSDLDLALALATDPAASAGGEGPVGRRPGAGVPGCAGGGSPLRSQATAG